MMVKEKERKIIHFIFGTLFAISFYYYPYFLMLTFFFSAIISIILSQIDEEWYRVFWYFLGVSIISIFYFFVPKSIIVSAMMIFAIGDTFSNIIGRRYGRERWPRTNKTYIGTIAGIISSLPIVYFLMGDAIISIIGIFSGMIAEVYSPLNDNFSVPVASFLSMSIVWVII